MARLFISHSSGNNEQAIELRDWLAANGWSDVFLDLDPDRGIAAGERWMEALQKAAYRCELVLALISAEWIASGWCKSEVDAARLMGKKVIAALFGIDRAQVPLDLKAEQFIDLSGDPHAYRRLKEGLKRAGLDPTSFPFELGRRPYPGFAHLEMEDAAVFFGRDAQIIRGLDEVRRLARTGVTRIFVIMGASGSGKSSFLRAGLWPRLKRDDLAWLPLPILRPERAAISGKYGLAQALQQVISDPRFSDGVRQRGLPRSRADIQDFIEKTGDGLAKLLAALRDIARAGASDENATPPTILLALDQGEELFNDEGRDEATRFIDILSETLTADPRTLAILVMRSDSFPLLQGDPSLAALPKDTFTLDMMLEGSYRSVIEGPARLIEPPLRIDPQLTDALLQDISGQDALPLLAFTLGHLYENYAVDNELTLSGYDRIGRFKGVIDKTVAQAFADAVARGEMPEAKEAQLALARRALIPHLAQINSAGQFVRHVAASEQIPVEARPLIDRLLDQRLLFKDRRRDPNGNDVDIVEVAHETLLRQPPFSDWLSDERPFLVWRERLSQARAAYETEQRGLLAPGLELDIACDWLRKRAEREIDPADRTFIRDSITAEDRRLVQEVEQERKRQAAEKEELERRLQDAERIAEEQKKALANLRDAQIAQSRYLADQARQQRSAGNAGNALLLALEALPDTTAETARPYVPEAELQLDGAWRDLRDRFILDHNDAVWSAAFSPDGRCIVTASRDTAHIWDAATRQPIGEPLIGHQAVVHSATFSPDGKLILTAAFDEGARVWNAENGEPVGKPLGAPDSPMWSAAFSPDSKRIVTASEDKTAHVWDAATGNEIGEPMGHRALVRTAAFSSDGAAIITVSDEGMLRAWDATTGRLLAKPHGDLEGPVTSAGFSKDGKCIATTSDGSRVQLWDAGTGGPIGEPLKGHEDDVTRVAFSPDCKRIVTASADRTARIWDAATGRPIGVPLRGHEGGVSSAAFSPDGKRIVTASFDKTARLWDAAPDQLICRPSRGHENLVMSAGFSPDGKHIVTASSDATVRLLDTTTGQAVAEPLVGHEAAVHSAAFSPDGKRIVTASDDGTAWVWDIATGKPIGVPLRGHEGGVSSAAFSPDGKRIVTASSDKTARLWDAATSQPIGEPLKGHESWVSSATFRIDGEHIVTSSGDETARLWDAATGKEIREFRGHRAPVRSAAFNPDGTQIVTASDDGTALIWDATSGQSISELRRGRSYPVSNAAFSPDGKRIVTACSDATAHIWDAVSGNPISELKGHDGAVWTAAFNSDGKRIVTASNDGTARIWDILPDTQSLVSQAKAAVPRCLTPAQRKAFYLPPEPPPWYIEMEKWPYNTPAWKQWLSDARAGKMPPLPPAQ